MFDPNVCVTLTRAQKGGQVHPKARENRALNQARKQAPGEHQEEHTDTRDNTGATGAYAQLGLQNNQVTPLQQPAYST